MRAGDQVPGQQTSPLDGGCSAGGYAPLTPDLEKKVVRLANRELSRAFGLTLSRQVCSKQIDQFWTNPFIAGLA
jgi:hypothetical protein